MNLDEEHASFLSTIAFPLPSPNESELTLIHPGDRNSTSTQFTEKPPSFRSSVNSNSNSQRNHTKYSFIGDPAHYTRQLYDNWVTDSWLLELGGLALALLSLGTLVVTLVVYQNKALPHWRWGLTLNSLLSILSQVITLSITTVLAGALSQHKWLYFWKSTSSLREFGRFDDASKGPWGSLMLLCSKSRFFHFGALGAVAMLFVQAFQPFIQQVVTYPSRWEAAQHSNATIFRAISFDMVDGLYNNTVRTYVSNAIKAGVYNGLYNNQASLNDVQPSCSSGRCSWQPHSTLAICAYVADVSLFVQAHNYSSSNNNITTIYTLPTGGLLAGAYQNMSLISIDNGKYASLAFQNNTPTAVLSDFYTFFISNKTYTPTLLETSLQLCAQTLNTTVTDGLTDTRELSRSTTVIENGGHKVIVPNDTNNYIMGDYSYNDLSIFLATIFSGNCTIAADGSIAYSSDAIEVLFDSLLLEPYDQTAMAIFLNGFANSITNALRSYPGRSTPFLGTLYLPQTYVYVSWPWLSLPFFVVLLTSIFLLSTIMQNRAGGLGVWKGAGLASLQALGDEAKEGLEKGLGKISSIEKRAEDIEVKLRMGEGGRWLLR